VDLLQIGIGPVYAKKLVLAFGETVFEDGTVIADDLDDRRCVFLAGLYRAEREIAEKLNALAVGEPPWPLIGADKAIPWVEKRTKLTLAKSQIAAVRVALASKVARSLNIELRKELNPPGEIRIERFGWTICPGDKGHTGRGRFRQRRL
jgi:hypothetical protein